MGAACCGGGVSTVSVLNGEESALLRTSLSESQVKARVLQDGVWRRVTESEAAETLKIEVAQVFSDRYQYGLTVPLMKKSQTGLMGGSASGVGDVSGHLGYEYLPDWDYNPWRPLGVGFISLVAPTGSSKYDSISDFQNFQNRGRGFWTLGLGTSLTKSWSHWDSSLVLEAHRSLSRGASTSQGDIVLQPGWGGSLDLGSGYNLKKLRFGGGISWNYEDPVKTSGALTSVESVERYATGTLLISYLFPEEWAGTFSYSDQTVFGAPLNAGLSRTFALILQKKWLR